MPEIFKHMTLNVWTNFAVLVSIHLIMQEIFLLDLVYVQLYLTSIFLIY